MRRLIIGLGAIAGAVMLPLGVASAQQDYPVTSGGLTAQQNGKTTNTLTPGLPVQLSGGGFAPGATVEITIESTPTVLGTVSASGSGAINTTVTIPSSVSLGAHTMKATGMNPAGGTLVLSLQVSIAIESSLALTGANAMSVLGVGLGAFAIGWLLVIVARPPVRRATT